MLDNNEIVELKELMGDKTSHFVMKSIVEASILSNEGKDLSVIHNAVNVLMDSVGHQCVPEEIYTEYETISLKLFEIGDVVLNEVAEQMDMYELVSLSEKIDAFMEVVFPTYLETLD